jgi:hypothetical protein
METLPQPLNIFERFCLFDLCVVLDVLNDSQVCTINRKVAKAHPDIIGAQRLRAY